MKQAFALLVIGSLTMGTMIGCEASAKVGDEDTHGSSYKKETTTVHPAGNTTKTETKVEKTY